MKLITVLFCLFFVSLAHAGQLANSYSHLPIKQWNEIGFDRARVSNEMSREIGFSNQTKINTCMSILADDIRYNSLPISEGYAACVRQGRKEGW